SASGISRAAGSAAFGVVSSRWTPRWRDPLDEVTDLHDVLPSQPRGEFRISTAKRGDQVVVLRITGFEEFVARGRKLHELIGAEPQRAVERFPDAAQESKPGQLHDRAVEREIRLRHG